MVLILSNGEAHASNTVSDVNSNKTHYVNKSFSTDNIRLLKLIMPNLDSKSLEKLNRDIEELLLSVSYGEIVLNLIFYYEQV